MRVLLLTDSDAFAGTERHIVTLAAALQATRGCDVAVGCPAGTALGKATAAAGLAVIDVPRATRVAISCLRRLCRDGAYDIIHAHNGRTCLLLAWAARGTPVRCVFTQHFLSPARVDRRGVRGFVSRRIGAWSGARMHHTIAISNAVARAIDARGDCPSSRVTTILNGIDDLPRFPAHSPNGRVRVASVARLQPEKKNALLVDAMAWLAPRDAPIEAHCYGGGSLRQELQARIDSSGARVTLHGHCDDAVRHVALSDLYVHASDIEAFGLAIVEAMALAKPVIAVDAGGPREIVEHGVTGLLVPPNDSAAMAEAIASLAGDPARRAAMGLAGRERFLKHFTAERMARETLAVYRAVRADRVSPS